MTLNKKIQKDTRAHLRLQINKQHISAPSGTSLAEKGVSIQYWEWRILCGVGILVCLVVEEAVAGEDGSVEVSTVSAVLFKPKHHTNDIAQNRFYPSQGAIFQSSFCL